MTRRDWIAAAFAIALALALIALTVHQLTDAIASVSWPTLPLPEADLVQVDDTGQYEWR